MLLSLGGHSAGFAFYTLLLDIILRRSSDVCTRASRFLFPLSNRTFSFSFPLKEGFLFL